MVWEYVIWEYGEYGSMVIWEYGGIWEYEWYGSMVIWEYGDMGVWWGVW